MKLAILPVSKHCRNKLDICRHCMYIFSKTENELYFFTKLSMIQNTVWLKSYPRLNFHIVGVWQVWLTGHLLETLLICILKQWSLQFYQFLNIVEINLIFADTVCIYFLIISRQFVSFFLNHICLSYPDIG
jgi:hypothetical protein